MILAAGFGTRLRPLTLELPKPAVPVGDRPLIAHIAAACHAAGVNQLVANAHHEHQIISNIIKQVGLNIQVIVEPEILGTAGGLAGARERLGEGAVAVWNGDILTEPPLLEVLSLAQARDAQVLALAPRSKGEGNVGVDAAGSVVRLRGQIFGHEVRGGDYVGVMALGPGVLRDLPARGCLIGDVALPLLARGGAVLSLPSLAPWRDLGDLPSYVAANFAWLTLHHGRHGSWCASDAEVASGVTLERSVVGRGVKVTGSGMRRRVIAWPNATLRAPLEDVIALPSGLLVPFDTPA